MRKERDYVTKKWKEFVEEMQEELVKYDSEEKLGYIEEGLKDFLRDVRVHFKKYGRK